MLDIKYGLYNSTISVSIWIKLAVIRCNHIAHIPVFV